MDIKNDDEEIRELLGTPYTRKTRKLLKHGSGVDSKGMIVAVVLADGTLVEMMEDGAIQPKMEGDYEKRARLKKRRRIKKATDCLLVIAILLSAWVLLSAHQIYSYNADTNNCLNMSSSMVKWCTEHGIQAELVYGHHEDANGNWTGDGHAWVKLFGWMDFEATALMPCDNSHHWIIDEYQIYNTTSDKFQDV